MRQTIRHGGTIDAATPEEVAQAIAFAGSETQPSEEYHRERGAILLSGTGGGTDIIKTSSQYDWLCERITLTGANAIFAMYENEVNGSNLLFVAQLGAAGLYSDGFSNTMYIPAHTQLVTVVTGGPANGQATYNLQIKLKQRAR